MIIHPSNKCPIHSDRKPPLGTNRYKYIAFHHGRLLPDLTLAWIIDAAIRGLMTPSAAQLLLIPDTRKGPPDTVGLRHIGKFRKSDCPTLKQLIRKIGKTEALPLKAKKAKNGLQNIKKITGLQTRKMQKTRIGTTPSDCVFLHKERGVSELKTASVQVSS